MSLLGIVTYRESHNLIIINHSFFQTDLNLVLSLQVLKWRWVVGDERKPIIPSVEWPGTPPYAT